MMEQDKKTDTKFRITPEEQLIRQAEGSTLPDEDNPEGEETVR